MTSPEAGQTTPEGAGKRSRADQLVTLLSSRARLFTTPEGQMYAHVLVDGHHVNLDVHSRAFRTWAAHQFYLSVGHTIGDRGVADALAVLEGQALHDGRAEEAVHLRVAELGGKYYLFLADQNHTVMEIDALGWRTCSSPPVNFVKSPAMNALPMPQHGGTLQLFMKYLNLNESDLVLAIAWLTAALRPVGPYPVAILTGEQGSGKTTAMRVLKRLVDPTESEDRAEPRVPKDMMIAADHEHVLAWDNLSNLTPACSDTICRIATGSSMALRTLYTTKDETVIKAQRPQLLNGIGDVVTRADLLERSIILQPLTLPAHQRRPEDEFWAAFEQDRAKMLGFLLNAVSSGIGTLPHVSLGELPRMADFAKWSVAAEPAWGIPGGTFLKAYRENQADAQDVALEVSPLALAVVALVEAEQCYTGQPQEALKKLASYAEPDGQIGDIPVIINRSPDWPKDARGLTNALKRLAPVLRAHGIEYVQLPPSNGKKRMRLCKMASASRVDSVA
jgi:hypothetical protein